MNKGRCTKYLPYILISIYIAGVLWITIINREKSDKPPMLTPFWEYIRVIKNQSRRYYLGQIIGNIALFIPFGFLIPSLPKVQGVKLNRILICGFCFSTLIELTQYATHRGLLEFDDIFNNTVGAVLGGLLFRLIYNRLHKGNSD